VLSEIQESRPLRFRCQIGHAYTAEFIVSQGEELGEAIRMAMCVMQERVALVERKAADAREPGRNAMAERYDARSAEYHRLPRRFEKRRFPRFAWPAPSGTRIYDRWLSVVRHRVKL
jgi:hypothetical protein